MSLFLLGMACTAAGGTIYVDADASGSNNGSSWTDAYRYLQNGLAAAWSGDEIRVAQGIYTPDKGIGITPGDREATFQLISGVTIRGGYAGFDAPDPNAQNIEAYETILSGDLSGDDIEVADPGDLLTEPTRAENSYHVVTCSWTDATTVVDGFIITGGNANGPNEHRYGGGMYNDSGSLTVANCTFSKNSAYYGGVMYNFGVGSPTIINCTFTGNGSGPPPPPPIFVDAGATGANDGSSWADAFNDLQDALAVASSGDEIWVAEGIYKPDEDSAHPNGTGSRTATFQLKNGVAIKGGYAGFGEPDPNARDIELYETILSGDLNGNDVDVNDPADLLYEPTRAENSYHVATGSGTTETAVLDGFTVTGGNADSLSFPSKCGGGMYNEQGSLTITDCTFSGNLASFGGAMYNGGECNPKFTNCTFIGNFARDNGGAMYNNHGRPTLIECTFSRNSATGFWGGDGGGMYNCWSNPILTNCTFTENSADYGGGMYNYYNTATLTNCKFSGNSASNYGGGMYNHSSSNPTLTNCTFSGNSASESGGAMYNEFKCNPTVTNCILWGNSASSGSQIYNDETSSVTVSYSDVEGDWHGAGNIDADPRFVNPDSSDYHLLPDSPCINAGDPNYVAEPNETDLDGLPRVIGGRIDMGAYEYPNTTPVACIVDGNQVVEAEAPFGARVTLDGSCSSDADSTPGTNDDIVCFDWYKVDACDPNFEDFLASGEIIDCNLPLGEHIIVLEVTDKADAFDTNEVTIIVQDTTPPDFTLFVTPTTLWPANHKMVLITPTWTVSDIYDDSPVVSLVSITMNEGDEAKGDGHTTLNIQIGDDGSIRLRAERSGTGSGRIYTITYQAVDDSGNVAVASATVTVPHDQR